MVTKESAVSNRFSFYTTSGSGDQSEQGSAGAQVHTDSVDILRSLQEHEQQRMEILGSNSPGTFVEPSAEEESFNPYEDAIKEALELLRKHRGAGTDNQSPLSSPMSPAVSLVNVGTGRPETVETRLQPNHQNLKLQEFTKTPPEADLLLRARGGWDDRITSPTTSDEGFSSAVLGEAYQAEIEVRRKQRQERMARYASRLAELKQESTAAAATTASAAGALSDATFHTDQQEQAWEAMAEKQPSDIGAQVATPTNQEGEVQRGVERVLMAILERAHNSRGRSVRREEEKKSSASRERTTTTIARPPVVASESDDALMRAMSDLLKQSPSIQGSASILESIVDHPGHTSPVTQGTASLLSADPHQELDRMVERMFGPPDVNSLDDMLAGNTDLDEQVDESADEKSNIRRVQSEEYTDDSDDYTDEQDTDEQDTDEQDDDDDDDGSGDSYDDDSETDLDVQVRAVAGGIFNGVLGPLSMVGGSTGVVLEADSSEESVQHSSILDSISNAMNLVTGVVSKEKTVAEHTDDDSSSSSETHELTRNLCAHIFPEGLPDRDILLSKIPKWDESDPDEPGYRIVRLNAYQLKCVQQEYDRLATPWKENAGTAKKAIATSADESFERDLKEAEELLDREEKRAIAGEGVAKTMEADVSTDHVEDSNCLEHFPGVRIAGKGEMGDLEYFHLPVIYKSHVTGFEPTKDLQLEPGNIVAGQYLVEGELGTAAFSTAYRCVDLSSEGDGPDGHEEVCLKVIKNTKDFFDQSLDEIKILELLRQTGQCNENHILEMKTFFYHREHLIIVTELLRQNLFEFGKFIIDNNEEPYFTIPRLSYITRQVLIAMKFIHGISLVHSDVKPENILLSSYSRSQVKLIDFGSSCYLTDRQSSYIQSRSYRAPEVILGLPYDGKIDIWSLGCVVAEMFTGEVTFQNDSVVSMLSRIEGICGKTPSHMIEHGRQGAAFFTSCGLLFEKVGKNNEKSDGAASTSSSGEPDSKQCSYDIFQPKRTTLSARLGFDKDLMVSYDAGKKLSREQKKQAVFVDFVRSLLTIDPDKRPSAVEVLKHPWMEYAATLTEDDIKYPST
jgi:serine/threonine protein kinase